MENRDQGLIRERRDFSTIKTSLSIPNLIDVQRRSYERFLQMNLLPEERGSQGLQAVFASIFPFSDFRETCSLDFVKYTIFEFIVIQGLDKNEVFYFFIKNAGRKD